MKFYSINFKLIVADKIMLLKNKNLPGDIDRYTVSKLLCFFHKAKTFLVGLFPSSPPQTQYIEYDSK